MKRVFLAVVALVSLAPAIGCHPIGHHHGGRTAGCPHCGPGAAHGGRLCDGLMTGRWARHRSNDDSEMAGGPPTAGVAYPYYTLRGPRDFLVDNPPSIGR